jgi:hypothetical protein
LKSPHGVDLQGLKALLVVALVTLPAEFSSVRVVASVTIDAAPTSPAEFIQWNSMATVAMYFGVCVPEREVCSIMIEIPDQPGGRIVATATILAEDLPVNIVGTMTVDTLLACTVKLRGCMAGFTT